MNNYLIKLNDLIRSFDTLNWDLEWKTATHHFPKEDLFVPKYPVSNLFFQKDGSAVVEIAATGFDKKDLKVQRKGDILYVIGKRECDGNEEERAFAFRNIATRDFELQYTIGEKMDVDKLTVLLEKGILTITIPMKEECKPTEKEFSIG